MISCKPTYCTNEKIQHTREAKRRVTFTCFMKNVLHSTFHLKQEKNKNQVDFSDSIVRFSFLVLSIKSLNLDPPLFFVVDICTSFTSCDKKILKREIYFFSHFLFNFLML